ncbi:Uma2 family endonuclease [Methylocystis sp. IM3]|uniref:Uma2 family endonuclease n=1 Tax=unclassified Methylocystis TaxID=2625913 RepID=UPI003119C58A
MNRPSSQYEYMSLDDFEELLADKPADEKWELIGGRVVRMMVGARWEHNYIIQNLAGGLRERLRASGSPCRTLVESFRLRSVESDSSTLPDIIVHCRALEPGAAYLTEPTALVEVMSEGSKARDRFEEWAVYQRLPSLRHYVLVERDRAHIEAFDRVGADWAGVRILDGLGQSLALPAIGVSIPLAEIYRDVLTG